MILLCHYYQDLDLYRKNYISPEKVLSEQSQPTSLKLFGRTLSITNYKNAAECFQVVPNADVSTMGSQIMRSSIAAMHVQPKGKVQMNSKAEVIAPVPIWSSFEGSLSLTFTKQQNDAETRSASEKERNSNYPKRMS